MKQVVEPIRSKKDIKMVEKYLIERNFRNYVIFVFGINTGLRISDILGLNVSDVFNKTYVEIIEKKTGKYKRFPLNNKLKVLLGQYLENKKINESLFTGIKHCRLDRSQVYRFLNEACGTIKNLTTASIDVLFDNGLRLNLEPIDFEYNQEGKPKIVRSQYPLRLAYGITIHKSQGMTFDKLVVNFSRIFDYGQAYVALSRARTLYLNELLY